MMGLPSSRGRDTTRPLCRLDACPPLPGIVQPRDGGAQMIDEIARPPKQRRTLPRIGERLGIERFGELER